MPTATRLSDTHSDVSTTSQRQHYCFLHSFASVAAMSHGRAERNNNLLSRRGPLDTAKLKCGARGSSKSRVLLIELHLLNLLVLLGAKFVCLLVHIGRLPNWRRKSHGRSAVRHDIGVSVCRHYSCAGTASDEQPGENGRRNRWHRESDRTLILQRNSVLLKPLRSAGDLLQISNVARTVHNRRAFPFEHHMAACENLADGRDTFWGDALKFHDVADFEGRIAHCDSLTFAVTSPSAVITSSTGFLQFGHSMRRDLSGL
jgi:hypothetical protein